MAIFQGDRFVSIAWSLGLWLLRTAAAEAFTPDQAGPKNSDVVDPFTPNQAIVPMIVAIVLIVLPGLIRFSRIVVRTAGCQNCRSHVKVEHDIALEMDGVGSIDACGKSHRSPSGRVRCF